ACTPAPGVPPAPPGMPYVPEFLAVAQLLASKQNLSLGAPISVDSPTGNLRHFQLFQESGSNILDFRGLGGKAFGVFPGQADGMDFCGFWLIRAKSLKFGGDDDAAELGGHVGGRRFGLARVPGSVEAAGLGVGRVVAGGGVPADSDRLAGE